MIIKLIRISFFIYYGHINEKFKMKTADFVFGARYSNYYVVQLAVWPFMVYVLKK